MVLKYLTIKFSNRIIGCKFLTIKEDLEFSKLSTTKLSPFDKFNLFIITFMVGNIFGGYTSKSW